MTSLLEAAVKSEDPESSSSEDVPTLPLVNMQLVTNAATTSPETPQEEGKEEGDEEIYPPRSRGEKVRDRILRILDSVAFQIMGYIVLFFVVADGALFFFFLMGWQSLCRPRRDCEPRNVIYDIAVQFLNVLFTYMATFALPWRVTNFIHVFGWGRPYRDNHDGKDLYGRDSRDVWFHIPLMHRRTISVILLLNCVFQYINQLTRIIFWSYAKQNRFPGNLWTNIFFVLSMLCAGIGAAHLIVIEGRVRRLKPDLFEPGPIQQLQIWWASKQKSAAGSVPSQANPSISVSEGAADVQLSRDVLRDLTQNRQGSVLGLPGEPVRGGLRLFAL